MLRRLLGLAIAAWLTLPGAALAADPTAIAPRPLDPISPPAGSSGSVVSEGHYFYVAAIEQGGTTVKVEGKLWIEGDRLGASVGCNNIGAQVTFDGRTLTVVDGPMTTEIGCPEEQALAERALIAALTSGPFEFDGSSFTGREARILVNDVSAPAETPPDQIGPSEPAAPTEPGEPSVSLDPESCRGFVSASEWDAAFGKIGSGTASGSGGAATTSSGGGAVAGSSGASSGSGAGTNPTTVGEPPNPSATSPAGRDRPAPSGDPTAGTDPAGSVETPPDVTEPDAGMVEPDPGSVAPAPPVDLPAPITSQDKPVAIPVGPAATPSAEACRQLLAQIRTMSAPVPAGMGTNAAPAELARDEAALTESQPELAFVLVLAGGLLLLAWLRSTTHQPAGR